MREEERTERPWASRAFMSYPSFVRSVLSSASSPCIIAACTRLVMSRERESVVYRDRIRHRLLSTQKKLFNFKLFILFFPLFYCHPKIIFYYDVLISHHLQFTRSSSFFFCSFLHSTTQTTRTSTFETRLKTSPSGFNSGTQQQATRPASTPPNTHRTPNPIPNIHRNTNARVSHHFPYQPPPEPNRDRVFFVRERVRPDVHGDGEKKRGRDRECQSEVSMFRGLVA